MILIEAEDFQQIHDLASNLLFFFAKCFAAPERVANAAEQMQMKRHADVVEHG